MTTFSLDRPATASAPATSTDPSILRSRSTSVWARPETVCLLLSLIFGWAMAFLTPPFQVPDEPSHLYRIWQLSEGHLLAHGYEVIVPAQFRRLQDDSAKVTFSRGPSIPFRDMFKGLVGPPPSGRAPTQRIDNTALYSPVPYLPQIVGVLIAHQMHWSTLGILYAGRVGTVLGYGLVGWWAIRVTPVLKWAACVTLTAPMAMFMAGSLSADPLTTAFAYLATAYCLRMILAKGPVPARTIWGLGVSLVALTLCKSAYFPIVFLLLAVPRRNWTSRRWWVEPALIFSLVMIALLGWSKLSNPLGVHEAGGDPAVQFHYVLYHPGKFLGNVVRTLQIQNYVLYISGLGIMGWLDTWMPISWMNIYTAAVLWLVLTYDEPITVPLLSRFVAAVGLCASVVLIILANYLVWTKTAARSTDGLQGRYLLPLVLLFFVIIQRPGRYRVSPQWLALGIAWCLVLADWVIFSRYYVL